MSAWRDIRSVVAGKRGGLIASLEHPERRQRALLQRILVDNADTEFGRRHGFGEIRTLADYQRRVPLADYEDLRTDIDRMMAGEKRVLCAEDVLLFEQTGGSTGGSKFLPFTDAGLGAMRKALLPWLDDLLTARPGILRGKAYWAISPATRQQSHTPGGTPIGIDNDALYFGQELAQGIAATLAVPPSVAAIESFDDWRFATLCHLLACRDLSFVSVWSPTYFLQLLDAIPGDIGRIADAVETSDAARATELRALCASGTPRFGEIWPALDTISCWRSGSSRKYADELAERFPAVHIQGKGLLATEGIVTLPLEGASSPVLAVDSGVFEFVAGDGRTLAAWELETGQTYTVVMTTAAGLYRYRLGDRVTVTGWYEASPCLEYVGREGGGSDLCGEKLTEEFVGTVLGGIPGFGMLVPVSGSRPSYLLLLDAAVVDPGSEPATAELADEALRSNPQYRYARELGQLPPLTTRRVTDPVGTYKRICVQSGQRLGDIKVAALASAWWGERYLDAGAS